MGIYLNPGADRYCSAIQSEIYIDKSGLLAYLNRVFGTDSVIFVSVVQGDSGSRWQLI